MLKGLKDGAYLAEKLGQTNDVAWMREEERDMRKCVRESMLKVMALHKISYLPGCAELGDEDPTSTSIAIMVCDETADLPESSFKTTFDRYYDRISGRFRGVADTFTPYECRNIDVFVRLGQRERALALARYFVNESTRPHGWNHLAEVVHAKLRAPSYIGDMPHTWVGSDYINAICSMFAYEQKGSMVLAAGVDPKWLPAGVKVANLPTPFGLVNYRFSEQGGDTVFEADGPSAPPQGFIVPLPASLTGLSVEVDGQRATIENGSIRFAKLPARVRLFTPALEQEPAVTQE